MLERAFLSDLDSRASSYKCVYRHAHEPFLGPALPPPAPLACGTSDSHRFISQWYRAQLSHGWRRGQLDKGC